VMRSRYEEFGWWNQGRGNAECLNASRRAVGLKSLPPDPDDLGMVEDLYALYARHRRLGFSRWTSLALAWRVWA
jgi:hypothetical protein